MPGQSSNKNTSSPGIFSSIDKKYVEVGFILIIFISAFFIRAYGIADNGITWDEEITVNAAAGYINYIQNFVFDGPAWHVNYEHPPVGKYIYGIAVWLFGGGVLDGRILSFNDIILGKWASALMGVATCILVYRICREFFDKWIGLASALILAFTPVFLAHTQIAALESPLAFFFTLTMFLIMMALKTSSRMYFVASAISLGTLLDVKFNALLILPVILVFYLLYRHGHLPVKKTRRMKGKKEHQEAESPLVEKAKAYFPPLTILAFCLIVIATWFILWPWLWSGTVSRLGLSLEHWTYTPAEHLLGGYYEKMPLYYYPLYFLVTTPLLLFIPLLAGLYMAVTSRDTFKYAVVLWFTVPFAYGFSNFVQGGMRYIIMIYPAMAILCGLGLSGMVKWAGKFDLPRVARDWAMPALTALIVVYLIFSVLSVRPYYLDYYNSLAGGGQNIESNNLFNIGWWGEGIYEAEKYVDSVAGPNATTYIITKPSDPHYKKYDLRSQFIQVNTSEGSTTDTIKKYLRPEDAGQAWGDGNDSIEKPDYIIVNRYIEEYNNVTVDPAYYKLIYSPSAQGAPLAKVYKVMF